MITPLACILYREALLTPSKKLIILFVRVCHMIINPAAVRVAYSFCVERQAHGKSIDTRRRERPVLIRASTNVTPNISAGSGGITEGLEACVKVDVVERPLWSS